MSRITRALPLLSILACGPDVRPGDGDGDGGSETQAPSTGASATSTDTGVDATGPNEPILDVGSVEPPDLCEPDEATLLSTMVRIDGGIIPNDPALAHQIYVDCMVSDAPGGPGQSFECEDGSHTIEVGDGGIPGELYSLGPYELHVYYPMHAPDRSDVFVLLIQENYVGFAAGQGPVFPDQTEAPADFWAPLHVELVPSVCEPEPSGDESSCYDVERQALRFTYGDWTEVIYDHHQEVEPNRPQVFYVEHAERRHDIRCRDTASQWYQWLSFSPILE